jgi:hypothetical protein
VLRFENADLIDTTTLAPAAPDGLTNIQSTQDGAGNTLNFVHSIFLDEANGDLYGGSLFTPPVDFTPTDCIPPPPSILCGSIGIWANASALDGEPVLSRHLYGPNTGLSQPHGLYVDGSRDMLYVANTFGGDIRVWNDASTLNGDVAPSRTVTSTMMGLPVHLWLDELTDRLWAAVMQSTSGSAILYWANASTLTGAVEPTARIIGPSTRISGGNNQTTHNVVFDPDHELLFVGHHTNEVLIFTLDSTFWSSTTTTDHDLTPRVLRVDDGVNPEQWSTYGLFYVRGEDRLYVSVGYTPNGATTSRSGGPMAGSPQNVVKVYENVSSAGLSGVVTPDRVIHWTVGSQYYPPQPLWVERY